MINFSISKNDFIMMWNDIVKFLTIIIIFHLLAYVVDDKDNFFSEDFLKSLLYITVGILTYYFLVKKFINNIMINKTDQKNISIPLKKIDKKKKNKHKDR